MIVGVLVVLFICSFIATSAELNEIISFEEATKLLGRELPREHIVSSILHHSRSKDTLPKAFSWKDMNGVNMVTRMRNQHIPVRIQL